MTETLNGATVDPAFRGPSFEDRLVIFGNNLACIAQGLVNTHYELCRVQLIMDALLDQNKDLLKLPDEEDLKKIERQALLDTKKEYANLFVDKEKSTGITE